MIPAGRSRDAEQLISTLSRMLKKEHEKHLGTMHDADVCEYCRVTRLAQDFLAEVRDKDADLKAAALHAFVTAAGTVHPLHAVEKRELFSAMEIGTDGELVWRGGYQPEITYEAISAGRKAFKEVFDKAGVKPSPITSPLPEPEFN